MLSPLWAVAVLKWFPESGYSREVARSIPTTGIVFPVCRMSEDSKKIRGQHSRSYAAFPVLKSKVCPRQFQNKRKIESGCLDMLEL